ncbi:unnamed protein product [Ambrosiozyma monospora]|uniref:Unnamed protein product n=1 Tax=Ambrosiozyma monospora TaxID=43982 RepID=A0ACB5STZ4_AMBMO|nr:unnamed protein product [Ambrosiozyma monospora]
MLFYGPPGTGKTSTILAMAKELYGPTLMKSRVLELNASDERGISIIRDKVKTFARLSVSNPTTEDKAKYPCPPYKLIILDEADCMTGDAQSALRRTMETYSGITRFCLICNYVTRIIDPLASRCSKFRFKSLDENSALARLQYICGQEKIDVQESSLKQVLRISEGDLRRAINYLQSLNKLLVQESADVEDEDGDIELLDSDGTEKHSQGDLIQDMFGFIPAKEMNKLIQVLQKKNLNDIMTFLDDHVFMQGYSASIIINGLHDKLLLGLGANDDSDDVDLSLSLDNLTKNKISKILFDTDCKLSNGSDETIQVLNCSIQISQLL